MVTKLSNFLFLEAFVKVALSPYILMICMEKLSHLIMDAVESKEWCPIRAGRHGPPISHLLSADDLLLFAEASSSQMNCILRVLNLFCSTSGHSINREKTNMFFSINVAVGTINEIAQCTGFSISHSIGKYLGVFYHGGKGKKDNSKGIIEKMDSKLAGWKSQCLSMADQITLAKSVLGYMACYPMQHTRIPSSICMEIEKCQREFVWGSSNASRKPHLIS